MLKDYNSVILWLKRRPFDTLIKIFFKCFLNMLKVVEKVEVAVVKNVALQNFGNDAERQKLAYNSQRGWGRTYPANTAISHRSTPRETFFSPAKRP